ncbi:hypothetical protein ElyMa_003340500 [Elysia marginata]|uniref:Uncharacterized protein n=1 Tax=Elysia marginata TaxID=1093978 RepID=A0AAV4JFF1_9GAST|nr:hypothetical protein ElyMa_003340500 [Elysia marginata]
MKKMMMMKKKKKKKEYFDTWYLKINTPKSVSTAFHLNNHEASKSLNIKVKNNILQSDLRPKSTPQVFGCHLRHLEGSANKIAKRNCILRLAEKARKNNMGRLTICSANVNSWPEFQSS